MTQQWDFGCKGIRFRCRHASSDTEAMRTEWEPMASRGAFGDDFKGASSQSLGRSVRSRLVVITFKAGGGPWLLVRVGDFRELNLAVAKSQGRLPGKVAVPPSLCL
jgi:hypothetical protein